jgi:hypothetical protein
MDKPMIEKRLDFSSGKPYFLDENPHEGVLPDQLLCGNRMLVLILLNSCA